VVRAALVPCPRLFTWAVPLPDFDNRPLAAGTLAPRLPTGRVNKTQLLSVLVDVNDIETGDPPRHPAARRHLRGSDQAGEL